MHDKEIQDFFFKKGQAPASRQWRGRHLDRQRMELVGVSPQMGEVRWLAAEEGVKAGGEASGGVVAQSGVDTGAGGPHI
jgi:hypothetical protein